MEVMPFPERGRSPSPGAVVLSEASQFEESRRRVYLGATLLGAVVLVTVWALQMRQPDPELFVVFGHPPLLVMCLWVTVWLLQRRPLIVAERVVFITNALAVLAQLSLALPLQRAAALDLSSSAYWMLVAVSILSFLMFSNRQALLLTGGFYSLAVLLPWLALGTRGQGPGAHPELVRVQLTCGAILMLLSSLAWYRERYTFEHGERLGLEILANTDPLTGLPNRRAVYSVIEEVLEAARRGAPGSLILLDLDHFKAINDVHGHNVGDEVLIGTARLIGAALQGTGHLGRWGGEEFLIALPGVPLARAGQVAEELRAQLGAHTFPGVGHVTASFGVTSCAAGDTLHGCTARADAALYSAKAAGRNRVASSSSGAQHPQENLAGNV